MHAALAALAVALILPAHASVIGSTPGAGDTVTEQPGTFSVVMNEEILSVDGAAGSNAIQVTDAEGLFYGDGCLAVEGDTASLEAQLGEAGDYAMTFQVVSADGHPVSDTIDFTFDPAEGEAGEPGVAEAPVCGEAAPEATADSAPATASAEQGTDASTEASTEQSPDQSTAGDPDAAAQDGGSFPFIAIGVIAVLALLALIAYRGNRLRGQLKERRDEAGRTDDEL